MWTVSTTDKRSITERIKTVADKKKNTCEKNCRLGKVGGQAVLEGVMMKSGDRYALSVRTEDGIKTEIDSHVSLRKKYKILNLPLVRGVVNMAESFSLSFKTLSRSAEMTGLEDMEPESKFERWLTDKLGDKLMGVLMGIAGVLGVVVAMFLFMYLPAAIASLFDGIIKATWAKAIIEGVIKIAIFVGYMVAVSFMPDIKRTFEYHGAEHKSIACYESDMELTPENAAKCTRLHPRCGTSFIFVVLIISIVIFMFPIFPWENKLLRVLCKLVMLPLIAGLSFEFIMYAGKHDNILTKILSAPGLAMQKITTREPTLEQLEVAIKSLKMALPDEFPEVADELAAIEAEKVAEAEKKDEPEESAE